MSESDNENKESQEGLIGKTEEFLKDVWGERAQGVDLPVIDWSRPISSEELAILLRLFYPFIQVITTDPAHPSFPVPQFRAGPSHWVIHNFGNAMSVSPGKYLYGPGNPDVPEGEGGDGEGSGQGTVIKQAFDTVDALMAWAKEMGWTAVEIIAGTDFMKWAALVAADKYGLALTGFTPTREETAKKERVKQLQIQKSQGKVIEPTSGG